MTRILFQLNLAKMRAPFDDPLFDDFKAKLDELHAVAKRHKGFVWRYEGEKGGDGYIKPYPNYPLIMGNMSAWENYQSLFDYTFSGPHMDLMKMKRKWFEQLPQPYTVLYYSVVEDLRRDDSELLEEALQRLRYLSIYGETPAAFGFGSHRGIL